MISKRDFTILCGVLLLFINPIFPGNVLSQSQKSLIAPGATLTKIAEGFRYTEGPAWGPDAKLYFTDRPSARILTWSSEKGLSDFRTDPGGANGLAFTKDGNLIVCESGARRVISIAPDGTETILADSYEGKKLNAPNDACVDSKGGIYFADHSMRSKEILEQSGDHIYYIKPDRSGIIKVTDDLKYPNGVIIDPERKRLYVTDSGTNETYIYSVNKDGTLKDKHVFATEGYDGIEIDEMGNVYITPFNNFVSIYSPDGKRIDEIQVSSRPSNLCFGGKDKNILFITAGNSVYSIEMSVRGL